MSATYQLDRFADAINESRPLVVLLGQDAWRSGHRPDPILVAALKRCGRHTDEAALAGLPSLLTSDPLDNDFYQWLADAYLHQAEAEWFEPISRLPLNAIFTTSVDPAISRALRANGRDVEAVLSTLDNPTAPRQRRNLHLTYLFGRAGEDNPSEGPPKSKQELLRRTHLHAIPLLSRIVETTTPIGVLVIDGFVCGRDWLADETLYGVLSAFAPGQIFWFGWDPDVVGRESFLFQELAAPNGPVTFVPGRLSTALRSLVLANKIDLNVRRRYAAGDVITVGNELLEINPATRLKTSTAATIIDDTWLDPLAPLGNEATYEEFRRFHGQAEEARRLIEGIRRGFAIERDFEQDLWKRTTKALAVAGKVSEPVLIHGQSGSGKSIALARLAFKVRDERRYPVLLASRVSRVSAVHELDDFCMYAEDAGAEATLVICDANAPVSRYRELFRGFQSRGRRVVLVGSAYRIIDEAAADQVESHFLEVPASLTEGEAEVLARILQEQTKSPFKASTSSYLLPAIYRMLPDVRPRLAAGLAREARVAEDDLRSRGTFQRKARPNPSGAMEKALLDAGLVDPKSLLDQRLEDFLGSMSDSASKAIDYVMMPGKLDCPVPVALLMRAVGGGESLVDIWTLFAGIDLFRWSSDNNDDVFVHPRLQIEANLILARRLGTARAEGDVAIKLLNSANPNSYCERRFVIDFVHKLGPDGLFGVRYADYYLNIARSLTEMRMKSGVIDPGLMLQEATLRRRFLRDSKSKEISEPDRIDILEEAKEVIDLALNHFGGTTNQGLKRACANLKVERAAIYSFRAIQQIKSKADTNEVWQFYEAARDSIRSALYAADTYHAIDVSLWSPEHLLREGSWPPKLQAELIADIWDGMERVDVGQLDPEQCAYFQTRRVKIAQTIKDNELEQQALEALERIGSRAGFLLKARALGGALWGQGTVSEEEHARAQSVVSFMTRHQAEIQDDARCLRYFLRAKWIESTKTYWFGGERSPIPHSENELRSLLEILNLLAGIEGTFGDSKTEYLRAVLTWRLGQENAAREIWHSLERETSFTDPRRVVRHHIWSGADGAPSVFHGRVISDSHGKGKARVKVDNIGFEIELLQKDFPLLEVKRGRDVAGGFHIAFNYIGPVAEPLKRRGGGR